jgi:hypothetical protein
MAFPSSSGTVQQSLSEAWHLAREYAGTIKQQATNIRNVAVSGNIASGTILQFSRQLANVKAEFQRIAAIPGIGAYAQAQVDNENLDISAEFTAMVNAITSTIAWVTANFPKDGNGWLLAQSISAEGRTVDRTFAPAATVNLVAALDSLIATID